MENNQLPHKLSMNNRTGLALTGILDVISFNLEEVLLESSCGMLLIKGKDLKVGRISLESGEVNVNGMVESIHYSEVSGYAKKGKTVLKRMFS